MPEWKSVPDAPGRPFAKHFDGKRYFNPSGQKESGFRDLLRWKLTSKPEHSPEFVDDVVPAKPPVGMEGGRLHVTLVNHSTVLLQQRGLHILTDPVWSERVSPVEAFGPKRHRKPGVEWNDLPRIDVVVLSHNHYDHLDIATLRRLRERQGVRFVVAKGLAALLHDNGIEAQEVEWGDSVALAEGTMHAVPAVHFSSRGLFDRNRTLWCGFVIEGAGGTTYFAGDTAFSAHFREIRERFGAPRLALLPIGAYEPRWFMAPVHMDPEEAVKAHEILGAQTSIAIHHGTFQLADEGIDTPKRRLRECAGESFLVLANGQSVTLS